MTKTRAMNPGADHFFMPRVCRLNSTDQHHSNLLVPFDIVPGSAPGRSLFASLGR
jgi:hypothetical protein